MNAKRIVIPTVLAARLAAHTGAEDHVKFDLSRVLFSPDMGLFLASNAITLIAVEPMSAPTATPWTPPTQGPVTKECWIMAADLKRIVEAAVAAKAEQLEFIDLGEGKVGFWMPGRVMACDQTPSKRALPPISTKFFAKESLPLATICSATALLAAAQSLAAAVTDPSAPVTIGMNGAGGWSKYPLELGVKSLSETACRVIVMPQMIEESDYVLPLSGKVPGLGDSALRILDWRTSIPPVLDKAASKEDIRMLTGLLMQMESDAPAVDPKGLDADQLSALRNLVAHVVAAVKVIRSGG